MNHPNVGVAVILQRADCILLGRRKSDHGKGTYSVPGGHLEMGEEPYDAAVRELAEETGITVDELEFIGFTNDVFSQDKHYITLFFTTHCDKEPVNQEPEKCEGWEWHSLMNLPEDLFLPLQNYFTGKGHFHR